MKVVSRIQTADGKIFKTEQEAKRHINKLIGDILSPLCHKLIGLKWTKFGEAIMDSLPEFQKIIDLNSDLTFYNEDGEMI